MFNIEPDIDSTPYFDARIKKHMDTFESIFDVKEEVVKRINPLIEKLKEQQDGPVGAEEYGRAVWDRESLREICNEVFFETAEIFGVKVLRDGKSK